MSSRFVRMGDSLVNVDDISFVVERGKNSEIYMRGDYEGVGTIPINKTLDKLLEILNGKEPSYDWIPCSERLPNSNGCYLVWRPHFFGDEIGMPAICYFDGQNTWHDSYGVDFERTLHLDDVTAWMPLPDPYEGERE